MSGLGLLTAVFLVSPALMSTYLGIFSWRRRNIPGAISFGFTMFISAGWGVTAALAVINSDATVARFWLNLMFTLGAFLSVAIFAAAAQTTGHMALTQPSRVVLWLIIPIITALLTMTSANHNWYLYDVRFVPSGAQNIGWVNRYGPWVVVHLSYSYGLILYAVVLLIQQIVKTRYRIYRIRVFLLLVGMLLPFLANIINSLLVENHTFITPIMLNLSAPLFFWVLFRYRLFDLLPIARDQAFEYMDDAIIIVNEDNRVVDVNPRAALLSGRPANEVIDKPLAEVYPNYRDAFMQALEGATRHQSIQINRGEQPAYFDLSIMPITRNQERVGKLIILSDRTEQRLAEARARRMETERERVRTLSEFVGAASHEFRTPLAIIRNSAYLINRITDPDKRAEKTTLIDNQVNLLIQLVDGLVTVVKLNAEVDLTFDRLDINPIVARVIQRLHVEAEAKALHLEAHTATDLPPIGGHVDYLQEAVRAILHNAIRYTESGGTITLHTLQREGQVVVTVQDTGIGIEAEHLPHIFDAFYRADKARSTAGFGTGLAIASRVVTLHGGHIQASSQIGVGTTLEMRFPSANGLVGKTKAVQAVQNNNEAN